MKKKKKSQNQNQKQEGGGAIQNEKENMRRLFPFFLPLFSFLIQFLISFFFTNGAQRKNKINNFVRKEK